MVRIEALSALALLPLGWSWQFCSEDDVKQKLAENNLQLVSFIAPDTEASKSIESEWKLVGKKVSTTTVDCSKHKSFCNELNAVSFPAIRAYKGINDMTRYRGPRTAKEIFAFVDRIAKPTITELDDTLKDFAKSDHIVVEGHFSENDENLKEMFKNAAEEYHDRYTFGVAQATEGKRTVACYNNVEGTKHEANDLSKVRAIHDVIATCIEPTIPQLTRRNEMKYLKSGKSLVYYFSDSASDRAAYTESMRTTARAYQEYLKLVTVDSTEYADMPLSMGIETTSGLAVQNLHNGQVFPHRGKVSPEAIGDFIVAISKGEVTPWDGVLPSQKASHDEL